MTSTFNFNGQDMRHLMIDNEPWFVAVDACRHMALPVGGAAGGATRHLTHLEADERRVLSRGNPIALPLLTGTFSPTITVISESGLYKLIMRSDKPEAKEFQNWVTKEVLPSIRKTGGYLLNEAARTTAHADTKEAMPLPEGFAQMFQMLFAPVMKPLEDKIEAQGAIILSMQEHIEKMANGQSPRDVWFANSGPVFTDEMSDEHLRRAIASARKFKINHDVLLTERQKRKVGRKAA